MIKDKTLYEQFMENPFQDFNQYGTDEERKERNKEANKTACGYVSYKLDWEGNLKKTSTTCKDYRNCDRFCREAKFGELEKRINHAQYGMELGDRLLFDRISHKEKEAYLKQIYRKEGEYLCLPQPNDEYIIIHSWCEGEGQELWEVGYDDIDLYNEDNGFDLNFYVILKDVPESKRISGNLGKPEEKEDEDKQGNSEDEPEKTSIEVPHLYKEGLTERDAHKAYREVLKNTPKVKVETPEDLQHAMFDIVNAMADQIKDAVVFFIWDAVSDEDLQLWNNSNVQITTIENTYSNYLDKRDDRNHKQSSFEAIVSRADRGDGLDEERQKAIDDYLRYHGT